MRPQHLVSQVFAGFIEIPERILPSRGGVSEPVDLWEDVPDPVTALVPAEDLPGEGRWSSQTIRWIVPGGSG